MYLMQYKLYNKKVRLKQSTTVYHQTKIAGLATCNKLIVIEDRGNEKQ